MRKQKVPDSRLAEVAETAKRFEPFRVDLEMDDNTEAVKDFGPLFDDVDYIDEEWGATEKATVREKFGKFIKKVFRR